VKCSRQAAYGIDLAITELLTVRCTDGLLALCNVARRSAGMYMPDLCFWHAVVTSQLPLHSCCCCCCVVLVCRVSPENGLSQRVHSRSQPITGCPVADQLWHRGLWVVEKPVKSVGGQCFSVRKDWRRFWCCDTPRVCDSDQIPRWRYCCCCCLVRRPV